MRSPVTRAVRPLALTLAALLAAPPLFARSVRCESHHNRYEYCRVNTHGSVRLRRETSHHQCHFGRTWGYDHRGIWVDSGCKAEFAVDEGRHDRYDHYDRYDDDDDDHHDKGAAIAAGAVLGVALIAVLANSKNKDKGEARSDVPSWAVGRFEGYNTLHHADVELRISPSGSVTGKLPNGERLEGHYEDGRVEIPGASFEVERTGSGLVLTESGNPENKTIYHRDK